MWKHYFGPQAIIYGVDIDPRCAELAEENIHILIANQDDRSSLQNICRSTPKVDIIVDDGGHTMSQQKNTFEELWDHLNEGGIYLCEDTHTSYFTDMGGGYREPNSFVEYTKNLIDQLTAWYSRDPRLAVDKYTMKTFGIHYYNSIVLLEKRAIPIPQERMKGTPSFALSPADQSSYNASFVSGR